MSNSQTRSRSRPEVLALAILVTVVAAAEARAQQEASVVGAYRYVDSHTHGRAIILGAFQKGIATAPAQLRPLLRSRILRADPGLALAR